MKHLPTIIPKLGIVSFLVVILCIAGACASAPVADFTTNITSDSPLTVSFQDQTANDPAGWVWFFGDENFSVPWTEVTADAGWQPRHSTSAAVTPDGTIVMTGGIGSIDWLSDTWRSTDDGATWELANESFIGEGIGRIAHSTVAMPNGDIVVIGGSLPDVLRSTDKGSTWTQISDFPGEVPSFQSCVVLPDGSIVMMGGETLTDTWHVVSDVWRSADEGSTWTHVTADAPWGPRVKSQTVVLPDGDIVLMGGNKEDSTGPKDDVWKSTDGGASWTLVNASAGWLPHGEGFSASVLAADGSIILTGGAFTNDVWRSADEGATWTQIKPTAEWLPRTYVTTVSMPDGKILLLGGEDQNGEENDVWQFMPASSTQEDPSHIYDTPGSYQVTLQAYNSAGFDTVSRVATFTVSPTVPEPVPEPVPEFPSFLLPVGLVACVIGAVLIFRKIR
ncbi:MAG TPA: kelch repeat-containing protein [Methanoregula sp.]|nr:kelch repeat-containing protein [Methanoregula sp.]